MADQPTPGSFGNWDWAAPGRTFVPYLLRRCPSVVPKQSQKKGHGKRDGLCAITEAHRLQWGRDPQLPLKKIKSRYNPDQTHTGWAVHDRILCDEKYLYEVFQSIGKKPAEAGCKVHVWLRWIHPE